MWPDLLWQVRMNHALQKMYPKFVCACHQSNFLPSNDAHLLEGHHIHGLLTHLEVQRGAQSKGLPWLTGPLAFDHWQRFQQSYFDGTLQHERFGAKPDHNVKVLKKSAICH